MTDIPAFGPGSEAELAWARSVLRHRAQWLGMVSGKAVLAMARDIVRRHDALAATTRARRP